MNKDEQIRGNVIAELRWVPDIDETNIDVSVDDAIVTLNGFVPTYNDRIHAECAAKRVKGVTGVANEIKVSARSAERYSDAAIVRAAVDAIRADLPAIAGAIQVVVSDAHVVLDGNVEWHWQRQRIESTVRAVDGVAAVTNLIVVNPGLRPDDVKRRIEEAFVRSAELDARKVSVDVNDGEITLRGAVTSLREKEEAQRTAWSAPGVRQVTNEIVVSA
jgi:osmotically-inducible protein OsmY